MGGSGAVTINFTTRSGTNRFSGSAYEYNRRPWMNTNNWANQTVNNTGGLPKNETKLDQYGVRVGGPIKLPGLYDGSGKAFYFFHYEELRFSEQLHEDACGSAARDARRHLPVPGGHRSPLGQPDGHRGGQPGRVRGDCRQRRRSLQSHLRPGRGRHVEQDQQRDADDGRHLEYGEPDDGELQLPEPGDAARAAADRTRGLQPQHQATA
jgi:hypothetical protein